MRFSVLVFVIVVVGVAIAAPFAKDKSRVWKPKAVRDKEAADAASVETRQVLPAGPTIVGESDGEPVASPVAADEPAEPVEVKATPPKPKIEWLVAADEPTVVHHDTPVAEEAPAALEARSEEDAPVKPRIEYLEAADEPTVVHEAAIADEVSAPVAVEEKKEYAPTALEAKTVDEAEPSADYKAATKEVVLDQVAKTEPVVETVAAEPVAEEVKAVVPAAVVEETKVEYEHNTALEAKTEPVAYSTVAKEEPAVVEVHSAPVIATVDDAVAVPVAAVAEVPAEPAVADIIVEEPTKIVEAEPQIIPVEAAPAIVSLDEPVAHSAEPVVPESKNTETIAY